MRFLTRWMVLAGLIASLATVFATEAWAQRRSQFAGREFRLAFLQNELQEYPGPRDFCAFIFAEAPANVEVYIPGRPVMTMSIPRNGYVKVPFPESIFILPKELKSDRSIRIVASNPVMVQAYSLYAASSDGYSAIPTNFWGTRYVVLSRPIDAYGFNPEGSPNDNALRMSPRTGQCVVVAEEDSTEVTITPSVALTNGGAAGQPFTVVLNKGEVWNIRPVDGPKGSNDISGTQIASNKPVGVISGHTRTSNPIFNEADHGPARLWLDMESKDYLIEMLPPMSAVGNTYSSMPVDGGTRGNQFVAVTTVDNAEIRFTTNDGTVSSWVVPKAYTPFTIDYIRSAGDWQSDAPFMLSQLTYSYRWTQTMLLIGDPSMVVLTPTDRWASYTITRIPDKERFPKNYLYLTYTEEAVGNLFVNGEPLRDYPHLREQYFVGTQGRRGAVLEIFHETILRVTARAGKFAGVLYGAREAESYGIPLCWDFVAGVGDSTAPQIVADEQCTKAVYTVTDLLEPFTAPLFFDLVGSTNATIIPSFTDSDNRGSVEFSATDVWQDAAAVFQIIDGEGNAAAASWRYEAPRAKLPDSVTVDLSSDADCLVINSKNDGSEPLLLEQVGVAGEPLLRASSEAAGTVISPGASFSISICRGDKSRSDTVGGLLVVDFGCGRIRRIPIRGKVFNTALVVRDYDHGKRLMGTNHCADTTLVCNNGQQPFTISSITPVAPNGAFTLQVALPATLQPGECLSLRTCFTPQAFSNTVIRYRVTTTDGASEVFSVFGRGFVQGLSIDSWDAGTHRIGRSAQSVIRLTNTGSDTASVVVTQPVAAPFSAVSAALPGMIPPNKSIDIDVAFSPSDIGGATALLTVRDLSSEASTTAVLSGFGVFPGIETVDLVFDTLRVGESQTIADTLIYSVGSDLLTIERMEMGRNDGNAFAPQINLSVLRRLPSSARMGFPVVFTPPTPGEFRGELRVFHDATVSGEFRDTVIRFIGWAIDPPKVEWSAAVAVPGEVWSCRPASTVLTVYNQGEKDISVGEVRTESTTQVSAVAQLPLTVPAGTSAEIPLQWTAPEAGSHTVSATIVTSEGLDTVETEYTVLRSATSVRMPTLNMEFYSEADAEASVELSGGGPLSAPLTVEYRWPASSFSTRGAVRAQWRDSRGTVFAPLITTELTAPDRAVYRIGTAGDPELTLPATLDLSQTFSIFLDTVGTKTISLTTSQEVCFDSSTAIAEVTYPEGCVYDHRAIRLIAMPAAALKENFTQNGKIVLELFNIVGENVNLRILDKSGRTVLLTQALSAQQNASFLDLDVSSLASGSYILQVSTRSLNTSLSFVTLQ